MSYNAPLAFMRAIRELLSTCLLECMHVERGGDEGGDGGVATGGEKRLVSTIAYLSANVTGKDVAQANQNMYEGKA